MSWLYVHEQQDWNNLVDLYAYTKAERPTKYPSLVCVNVNEPWDFCYTRNYKDYLPKREAIKIDNGEFPRIKPRAATFIKPSRKIVVPKTQTRTASPDFDTFFGATIRKKRDELGVTRAQLTAVLEVGHTVLMNVEKGAACTFERAIKICSVLDLDIHSIVKQVPAKLYKDKLELVMAGGMQKIDDELAALQERMEILTKCKQKFNRLSAPHAGSLPN